MAGLTGNQCTIITIIPMEVECNVTNASSPTASDGSVTVQVFGGTAPYLITWTNGITSQQGDTLTNLLPGTYSATVVDYFGDYSTTTECVVGSSSQIVYQFDSCPGFAAQTIYVSGSTYAPPFPNNKPIIVFNEIVGCWEFIGPISSVGLTYSALTVSNSHGNCSNCNPPTPTPPTQDTLCLTGLHATLPVQYEFTPDGVDSNGNFKWINTANGLTMSYNVSNGRWEVLTWTSLGNGQPYLGAMTQTQSPPSLQPLGTWQNLGNSGGQKWAWNVATGPCVGINNFLLSVIPSPPQCAGQTGNAIMTASNGVPPYQYSIQGIQGPQSNGQFTGVVSGPYVGQVIDSVGNVATTNFTIGNGQTSTAYTLLMTKSNEVITNPPGFQQTLTYDYSIVVNPSLPSGVSLTFDIDFSHTEIRENASNSGQIQFTNSITGILDGSPMTFTSSNPLTLNGSPSPNCQDNTVLITTYTTTNQTSITFDNSTTIAGTVSVTSDLNFSPVGSCGCPIEGTNKISVQATNVRVVGNSCDSVNHNTNNIEGQSFQSGCFPQP